MPARRNFLPVEATGFAWREAGGIDFVTLVLGHGRERLLASRSRLHARHDNYTELIKGSGSQGGRGTCGVDQGRLGMMCLASYPSDSVKGVAGGGITTLEPASKPIHALRR